MLIRSVLAAAAILLGSSETYAQPTATSFTYQGVANFEGEPYSGVLNVRTRIVDAAVGGNALTGTLDDNTVVADGLFTLTIDFGFGVFQADPIVYLELSLQDPNTGVWYDIEPASPILAVPAAQEALFAEESAQWKTQGSGITNASSNFVGINRDSPIGAEYFGINAPVDAGYGGMYISTDGSEALPFYGYFTGFSSGAARTGWHYLDGQTGEWRLNLGSVDRLRATQAGQIAINAEPNTNQQFLVESSTSAIAGRVTSGSGNGVTGTTVSSGGIGVLGFTTGANSYGVYGESAGSGGYGGYFLGRGFFSGNVGIGDVIGPAYQLQVAENSASVNAIRFERTVASTGASDLLELATPTGSNPTSQFIEAQVGSDVKFRVNVDGNIRADGTFTGGGADFAEMVHISGGHETVTAGDVIVLDPNANGSFTKSQTPRSRLVAGIYSTKPGILGSTHDWDQIAQQQADADGAESNAPDTLTLGARLDEIPLAVVGIVPCKVSAENGPIRPGDLLVTAALPGHAMRDDDPRSGTIVGKAMGTLEQGTGTIRVLVSLQ